MVKSGELISTHARLLSPCPLASPIIDASGFFSVLKNIYSCNQSKMRSRKQQQESVDSSQTQSEKKKKKKKHAKFSVSRKHKATDSLCSRQTHALHGSEGKTRETTTGHRRSDFRKDLRPPVTRWNPKRKSLRSGERGGRFYRSYPV